MNDNQLKSFILVAELKSFSKAAEAAFVSVTALKKQIDTLEREVGVQLVARTNKGISLTAAGTHFLKRCRHVSKYLTDMVKEAQQITLAEDSTIRIGYAYSCVADYLYHDALFQFKALCPDVQVELTNMNSTHNERYDFILNDNSSAIEKMTPHILCEMAVYCVMNSKHALAGKTSLTIGDLAPYEIDIPNAKIVKQLLTTLLPDLEKGEIQYVEVGSAVSETVFTNLLSTDKLVIELGYTTSLRPNLTQAQLSGYHFPYMIYAHAGEQRKIANDYLAFLLAYYAKHYAVDR